MIFLVKKNQSVRSVVQSGVGACLASAFVFLSGSFPAFQKPAPNIVGLGQDAAITAITAAGLTVGRVAQENSKTAAEGSVISQDPAAESSVAQGSAVNLVISSGPQMVAVPNVVGMTQADATTAIIGAGLTVGTVTQQNSSTVASGSVVSQDPAAGSSVAQGSAVNLVISSGAEMVAVPDVAGMTQADAATTITGAGLTVGTVTQQNSSTVASGSVVSQDPAAGSSVAQGSAVNLVISSGSQMAIVPNVVGLTQADATTAITGARFTIGTISQQNSNTVVSGSVMNQYPVAESSVAQGSAVNLVVSLGPRMLTVPNMLGRTQDAATTAITRAGLTVGAITQQNSNTVISGTVISQDPAGGSSVIQGSQVALVISQGAGPPRISFQLTTTSPVAASNGTAIFQGTVTNNSGTDLNATDLFFNFFDFSAESVTPSQDLGTTTGFLIPKGSTSAIVNLFEVRLGTVPAGSSFQIQVQLEDANLNLSAVQTVIVSTPQ